MNAEIKVSLIIPVYNTSLYLRQCLNSATGQSLKELEIICVDDGSTDDSWDILQEYEQRCPNIRCIRFQRNCSGLQARKTGVQNASGKYIMFLDSDDYLEENACETAYNAICNSATDMLQFQISVENCSDTISPENIKWQNAFMNKSPAGMLRGDLLSACFVNGSFVWSLYNKIYCSKVCKSAFQKIGDEYITFADDIFIHFFLLETSETYASIQETLYHYCFGRGMTKSGRGYMVLNEFLDYCKSEVYVCRALERYVSTAELKDGINYKDALKAILDRRIRVHSNAWLTKLKEEDRVSGFLILYKVWGSKPLQTFRAIFSEFKTRRAELTGFFVRHAPELIVKAKKSISI